MGFTDGISSCRGRTILIAEGETATMDRRDFAEALPIDAPLAREERVDVDAAFAAWRFDGFTFDGHRSELCCNRDGKVIVLRPKAELLLRAFLTAPGRVLAREALIAAVWPSTVVTDDSLVQCVGELRIALGDGSQRLIRTVPRRGYRLDATVEQVYAPPPIAASLDAEPITPVPATTAAPARTRPVALWTLAAIVAVAALAVGIALRNGAASSSLDEAFAGRRVVAVMPFIAAGEDPGLRDIADRLGDEIAAQMVTYPGARAIGRARTAAFNTAGPDLERLASALHAAYAVTGRVRPAADGPGATLEVTLLTVPQGDTIGSAHFDVGTSPMGPTEAEVGQLVVNFVRGQGMQVELRRATAPGHVPDAVDLTLIGWHEVMRISSPEDIVRARERFRAALREDPDSLTALSGLVAAYVTGRSMGMSLRPDEAAEFARSLDRMMRFAPNDPNSAALWADLQMQNGRPDLAVPAMEKAIRLAPNFGNGHLMLGQALLRVGRMDEAQAELEHAVRLALLARDDRRTSTANMVLAEIAIARGDDKRAAELARRAIAIRPSGYGSGRPYEVLAAADALAGQGAEAAAEMAVALERNPAATVTNFDAPRPSTNPAFLAHRARLYEGLRKAGIPER
jgi:DNA-binding winged helix-turn-helix (wHTH) protein/TolB-like protein/Tfp pilus assembly protein PilF